MNSYKDTFQRIDENDDGRMPIGFTMIFHECTLDFGCKFVVRRNSRSELEKIHTVEDGSKFYNVWKKLEKTKAKKGKSKALDTYMYKKTPVIKDTNLFSSKEHCGVLQRPKLYDATFIRG